jgi:4-amino-4-deoxy-L-arabinose transferase-like glycosyltransferase
MNLRLLLFWCLLAAAALFVHLGGHPLLDADEGRNGEVGREMAETNDYVMPRLDGLPYVDKPIVYFAAEALAMEVMGPTEAAARLPALLFTLATAALVAWFARRVWDRDTAVLAAIVMLSMPLTLAFSRTVIFDSALMFFVVLAGFAFYLAVEGDEVARSRGREVAEPGNTTPRPRHPATGWWAAAAWLAIGLGVITKGPVAVLLPLMAAIPYAIKRRRFGALWSWGGLVGFLLPIVPWVWAVTKVVPDFLRYVLVTETMQRLATKALKRTGPPWYFLPFVLGGALPWTVVLVAEVAKSFVGREVAGSRGRAKEPRDPAAPQPRDPRPELYLWLSIAIPFLFFSLSQSKRPQYVLPLMPAIALLAARATRGVKAAAVTILSLGVVLLAALEFAKLRAEYVDAARTTALGLGIVCIVAGIVAFVVKRRDVAYIALSLPVLAIPLVANPLMNALSERRSTKSLVARLQPHLMSNTEVVGIEAFTGSMAFYLRRPIPFYTPDAEEMTSNYVIRHYDLFAGAPLSPIRRMSALPAALADRTTPRLWIVRNDDRANRGRVEAAGGALVAEGAHFVAYTMRR